MKKFRKMLSLLLMITLLGSLATYTQAAEATEFVETTAQATVQAGKKLSTESATSFLDEFFQTEQAQALSTGAAITIVQDGKVIASKGYGYANAEEQKAVTADQTVFRIASVSKTLTAIAIMQLVEQGKIDVNESITQYLPNVKIENPFNKPVNVHHLLTHESGFEVRDPNPEDLHNNFDSYVSIEDYVAANMPPVVREPGSSYMYDNFASLLLGLIVQNVSDMPYEEYMETYIFKPLGMINSGFELKGNLLEDLVTGYDTAFQPVDTYVFNPTIMPHGGMLSTAEDMGKLLTSLLNGGNEANGAILKEDTIQLMTKYQSYIHPVMPNTTYGFEAPTQLTLAGSSDKVIIKYGDLPGNSSMFMLIPEKKIGVFLSYNSNFPLRDLFYSEFIQSFFPEYASPVKFSDFEPLSIEQLQSLAGLYTNLRIKSLVSSVEVNEEGLLTISDAYLGPRQLQQVDNNLFVDELAQYFTAFQVDQSTNKVYMKESYLNPLGYAMKGDTPAGFSDIQQSNQYASYIHALQSIGLYANEPDLEFQPLQPVTRAEYLYNILTISGIKGSDSTETIFTDIVGHPLESYILAAYELGMISGDGDGTFKPDRYITRQEAAVMIWNVYQYAYPTDWLSNIQLTGETGEWAVSAVKIMAALGYHGPEALWTEEGAFDFQSKKFLTRQEEAAIIYQMLLQPVEQIIAQWLSLQSKETE